MISASGFFIQARSSERAFLFQVGSRRRTPASPRRARVRVEIVACYSPACSACGTAESNGVSRRTSASTRCQQWRLEPLSCRSRANKAPLAMGPSGEIASKAMRHRNNTRVLVPRHSHSEGFPLSGLSAELLRVYRRRIAAVPRYAGTCAASILRHDSSHRSPAC